MNDIKIFYRKRKHQILPVTMILAAFFVLFQIIVPQWNDVRNVQELLTVKKAGVEAKEATVLTLNSIPDDTVDSDYTLITRALPVQKDVILIFSELEKAAQNAGVKLGGYSVKVGGIYTTDSSAPVVDGNLISGVPYLNTLVSVSGNNENLRQFANELYKSLPLIEIVNLDISRDEARYDVNFFFKPVSPRPTNADTTALTALSADEINQIETLKGWVEASGQ